MVTATSYRYTLSRAWDETAPAMTFVLLNPSTADATHDDPTLRRCIGFARRWGYGSLTVVNLFALRATNPRALRAADAPVGAENDAHIIAACEGAARIVCGWGNHGILHARDIAVCGLLLDFPLWCLGTTKQSQPKHPLYVPYRQRLMRFYACRLSQASL